MSGITYIGIAAAFCTTVAFFPQVVKILKTKKTEDISLSMYIIFMIGLSLWLAYGIILEDLPIILANGITLILAGIILAMKFKYK